MLNAFSYTGGFAYGGRGARRVTNLDSSVDALRLAERTWPSTARGGGRVDRRGRLRSCVPLSRPGTDVRRDRPDPPKFAFSRGQIDSATRGYKDINLLSMRLCGRGTLCTFSCSGVVSEDLFQKVVFGASLGRRREVRILERLAQGRITRCC